MNVRSDRFKNIRTQRVKDKANKMEDLSINEILKPYLSIVRIPKAGDKVFKDECAFSFDTPVNIRWFNACDKFTLNR